MSEPTAQAGKRAEELEEWFLTQLEAEQPATDELMGVLRELHTSGQTDQALAWADLLLEALQNPSDAISLVELQASWHEDTAAFRARARELLGLAFQKDRTGRVFLENVGFDKDLALAENLRRLRLLFSLAPGMLCYEKTWGFGVVKDLDDFYQRVTVDFDGKPGHQMAFAYAAEVLQPIDEDHLLARKHRDPGALNALTGTEPGEVVKIALRSFGPMNAVRLQELLVAHVVSEGEWKKFWDGARKALKGDPLVDMPAARSQPIRLLRQERLYDTAWFAALAEQRKPAAILKLAADLQSHAGPDTLSEEARGILSRQLDYVARAAWDKQPDVATRALLCARHFRVDPSVMDLDAYLARLFEADRLLEYAHSLPARWLKPFLDQLTEKDEARTTALLLELLPRMYIGLLNEAMDYLIARQQGERCASVFRSLLVEEKESIEILYWLARHLERVEQWDVGVSVGQLADLVLTSLERTHHGEHLKARKQLQTVLERADWLSPAIGAMNATEQRQFMLRLKNTTAVPVADRQSLLARVVKLFPALHEALKTGAVDVPESVRPQGRFTSWRSYRERRLQYEKLINEDIPQNSREIAIARSYGDLSENHEYKAAKEMQGILLRRRGELEQSLAEVRGTDFAEFPATAAGPGTMVRIEGPAGETRLYAILGEWDSDQERGILSYKTRLAEQLEGHRPGDEVRLPSGAGADEACRIVDVSALSPEIRAWIQAEQAE
ncbi:MAG: GreA/GreB family elongation factor [Kiritimatiellae bacterium]|nr:GreA/GreB family elongation factor [Kiritimatiellia bacterium]